MRYWFPIFAIFSGALLLGFVGLVVSTANLDPALAQVSELITSPTEQTNANSESSATLSPEFFGHSVETIFSTIQFSLSVLSSVIIVFAIIISFVVGRSAKQTRDDAKAEIKEFAELYERNLDGIARSVDQSARASIDKRLNTNDVSELIGRYQSMLNELKSKYAAVEKLVENYHTFRKASEELEDDYVGSFFEIEEREDESNPQANEDRTTIQQALVRLQDGALRRSVSANTIFNGAQTAARYRFSDLSHRLAVLAQWLDPSTLYKMRVLRSEFESGDRLIVEKDDGDTFSIRRENPLMDPRVSQSIRARALEEVYQFVSDASLIQVHLVYSEVWNIAVHASDLDGFIENIDAATNKSENTDQYVASYVHFLLARAYALRSGKDWKRLGAEHFRRGIEKLAQESQLATWHSSSRMELMRLTPVYVDEPPKQETF